LSLLSDVDVADRLRALPGWERSGDTIHKHYRFPSFMQAVAFVNQVAEKAEALDHHPDITIEYTKVTLTLSTDNEGGLTERDFRLAERIDA
jgi:4a-hydroxytetrahydrobiopterin dehydratase